MLIQNIFNYHHLPSKPFFGSWFCVDCGFCWYVCWGLSRLCWGYCWFWEYWVCGGWWEYIDNIKVFTPKKVCYFKGYPGVFCGAPCWEGGGVIFGWSDLLIPNMREYKKKGKVGWLPVTIRVTLIFPWSSGSIEEPNIIFASESTATLTVEAISWTSRSVASPSEATFITYCDHMNLSNPALPN